MAAREPKSSLHIEPLSLCRSQNPNHDFIEYIYMSSDQISGSVFKGLMVDELTRSSVSDCASQWLHTPRRNPGQKLHFTAD